MEQENQLYSPLTTNLSDEVLLHIISFLNLEDVINLSQTCRKFDNLLKDKSLCSDLKYQWDFQLGRLTFVKFLGNFERAVVITKLNLNDLYWVPSGVIRNVTGPLVNLVELHVAGTQLSLQHLKQILSKKTKLIGLSWSWADQNSSPPSSSSSSSSTIGRFRSLTDSGHGSTTSTADIAALKAECERLQFLLIHIPMVQNAITASYTYHPGLTYFISMCKNLRHLWILSWPKTHHERKLIEIFGEENMSDTMDFPKLQTFTLRVLAHQRVYTPRLIHSILHNIEKNSHGTQLSHLWLDHPFLSGCWSSVYFDRLNVASNTIQQWPKLNLNSVETLSLPLIEKATDWLSGDNNFEKVKHLQVTDGLPRIVNLNGVFDMAHDLESIIVKAFNVKLDWNRFVEMHPKLRLVNVCQDVHFPYPDVCIAFGRLGNNLRKLALPVFSLMEIRNSVIVDEYRAKLLSNSPESGAEYPTNSLFNSVISRVEVTETESGGFKRRIAMTNKINGPNQSISGVDLLTVDCPLIEEFEIGFSATTRPGTLITQSLMNICRWKNLVKLTIENAPVYDGQFLIRVAKNCKLTSLRLKGLGSRAKCTYMNELCTAVQFLDQLKDFRLEQNYIGSSIKLFTSLGSCVNLQRFLLWSPSNDLEHPLEPKSVMTLMDTCKKLMMLYLTVGSTTKQSCDSMRKAIESRHKKFRPGLSIVIRKGSDAHQDSLSPPVFYPSIHYRQMVDFSSQIGLQNDFDVPTSYH